jgi:L-iditol 2-dehydrogenase
MTCGNVHIHDEPIPNANESLIRIAAIGICGSDLHWFSDAGIGDAKLNHPLILGHEFAGVVECTAQHVAVDPLIACGIYEQCCESKPNSCAAQRFAEHGADDGALREYMAWRNQCLFPLPDALNDEDSAMLEPLGVAIHAVRLANIEPGMTAGVFGCGPIGLLIAQVARVSGAARVMATEKLSHRIDAANLFGVEAFPADGDEICAILSATNRRGVDVAFEVAGEAFAAAQRREGSKVIVKC